jgi:hypothetical protein
MSINHEGEITHDIHLIPYKQQGNWYESSFKLYESPCMNLYNTKFWKCVNTYIFVIVIRLPCRWEECNGRK